MKFIRPIEIVDAVLVDTNVAEADHAAYNAGTTYGLAERVIVVASDTHKVYESLQAENTGHTPATSPTWWLEISSTNRWKMFDEKYGSQTENADSIEVELLVPGRMNSLYLGNLSGASAHVTMTDDTEGVVYDREVALYSLSAGSSFYAWFFDPIVRRNELALADLPPYSDVTLAIAISDEGATAKCGICQVGLARKIGDVEWGLSVGIQDFSLKKTDDFGDVTITRRAYAKRASFPIRIPRGLVDEVYRLLALYRATPVVWIGTELYDASIVYGFFKDLTIQIPGPKDSLCTLDIEGLT